MFDAAADCMDWDLLYVLHGCIEHGLFYACDCLFCCLGAGCTRVSIMVLSFVGDHVGDVNLPVH